MPSLSPLDGRYASRVAVLAPIFSEFGLMAARTKVEIQWLLHLAENNIAPKIDENTAKKLIALQDSFADEHYQAIKAIEKTTNHDVKAVEMFLREYVPKSHWAWIHWGCTSEDINNTSYALMLQKGVDVVLDQGEKVFEELTKMAHDWKAIPMLCRTHGQTATPSTLGKEFGVFTFRIGNVLQTLSEIAITAKINGATGTFGAHHAAFPEADWLTISATFVTEKLELSHNPMTTQIESHDQQVAVLHELCRYSSIIIDLCRDVWGYVSLGYFGQKTKAGEVGSSTMPHKVNPIDFENAEGNMTFARGVARTMADALPISRWQRDLTDSTLQRNFGVVFGHVYLACASLQKGLTKLEVKEAIISADLDAAPEVLGEAVQTVMRTHGDYDAYDKLKTFSRGRKLTLQEMQEFIETIDVPAADKARLKAMTPQTYTGLAEKLVDTYL